MYTLQHREIISPGWSGKITPEEILYVPIWINHRLCYSLLKCRSADENVGFVELPLKGADQNLPALTGCQGSTGHRGAQQGSLNHAGSSVHNFLLAAQASPQRTLLSWSTRSLSRHLKGSSIQSCLSCLCQESEVKEMPGSCWAAECRGRFCWAPPREHSSTTGSGCRSWLRAPQSPGLPGGASSTNPLLQAAGTTCRVCSAEQEQGIKEHRDNDNVMHSHTRGSSFSVALQALVARMDQAYSHC